MISIGRCGTSERRYRFWWKQGGRDVEGFPTERKHVLSTEHFPVSAYAGSSKNLENLEKSRAGVEALQLPEADAPQLLRLCRGCLSEAQNQRLHLIDFVCSEERIG